MKIAENFSLENFFDNKNLEDKKIYFKKKRLVKGEIIYNQGEKCTVLTIMVKGKLDIVKYFSSGKEQKIGTVNEGEMFGGVLLFNEDLYPANIIAEENCEIYELSKEQLLISFENKQFLVNFLKEMSKKMVNLSNLIEILSYSKMVERVAKYILMIYEKSNGGKIIKIKTKTEIARALGSSREVVSRAFKKLKDEKIIKEENSVIEILSLEKLEEVIL
ncbi:Crp/Fnr family transcriptional regulator [Haliovirga abyssi]|uniref:Crp/Fnr family transcriptional regulator n=1 Tax=Haliovirga abyssi TaxID=2996794 RepID=A0AAU9DDA3_9FUSO|nr:Crp/Fnr family transcriptional regulator [Haliovirga abyssi]BDU51325.1 hypothetical protein HLVA_18940 [Haliovirga abyssi]